LQQGVATAAGVDKSIVTIRVTAASVRITASIAVPAATTAVAVQESLSSTLGNATSASAALGITVESGPTINILMDSTDDVAVAVIAGGSAGGVLACIFVVLLGVAGRARYMKRQAAKAPINNIEMARAPTTNFVPVVMHASPWKETARAPTTKAVPVVVHASPWETSGDTGTARAHVVPTVPAAAKVSLPVQKELHVAKRSAPQNIAAALVACGLEHRVKTFEDDGYTLDKARTALSAGQKVLMADLQERKLPLGECRRMINHLQATDTSVAGSSEEMPGDKDTDTPEWGGGALATEGFSQVMMTEEWLEAAAAKQAAAVKAAEEKAAAAAAAKKPAAREAVGKKAISGQAAANKLFAGRQVTVWLTESCEINASDAKLYADALAQLGVDRPADLQMIDGDEVAWPSAVKLLDREKIQARLETDAESSHKRFTGRQVTVWLTESCEINASDAKLYADVLAQLGVDRPVDLQMIDSDEVAWPSAVKLLDREKIQARLETDAERGSCKMPLGSWISKKHDLRL